MVPQLELWTTLSHLHRVVGLAIVQTGFSDYFFALLYQHAIEISRSTASFLSALLFSVMCSKSEDRCANSLFMTESKVSGFRHYKPDNSSNKHTRGTEYTHCVPSRLCY